MFCPNCGKQLEEGGLFCEYCGARVADFEAEEAEQEANGSGKEKKRVIKAGLLLGGILGAGLLIGALLFAVKAYIDGKTAEETKELEAFAPYTDEEGKEAEKEELTIAIEPKEEKEEEKEKGKKKKEEKPEKQKETPAPTPALPTAVRVTDPTEAAQLTAGLGKLSEMDVADSTASSIIQQERVDNFPIYLFDGDSQTNWQEGVEGPGIGEFVYYTFKTELNVEALTLKLGNWKDSKYYYGNHRPSTLTFSLGGDSYQVDFPDQWEEFCVKFTAPIPTQELKITIDGVYQGTDWDDTAITDVGVWCS